MKPIIIDMEDMSDSSEVYGSKPSPIFAILIYTLVLVLVVAGVWMCLFQIDVVTKADGMIRNSNATATITNVTGGKITSWNISDGAFVSKGEILFTVNTEELEQQKVDCEAELDNVNARLEILNAYLQVLDGQEDALQSCYSNVYYAEFETRKEAVDLNCDTIHSDASTRWLQYQNSMDSINSSIGILERDKEKLAQMLTDIRNRSNSFSSDEVYYYAMVEEYINSYNYTASQYDIQIQEFQNAVDENGQPLDYENKIQGLQNQKAQALNQAESEMVASIEQLIVSNQSNLDSLNNNLNEVKGNIESLNNGSEQLSTEQIIVNEKNAVYAEINTYQSKQDEYENTLASLQSRIDACEVRAQCDGYLNLNTDRAVGDYVSTGESIGNIVPENDGFYKVVIYVENQDIGSVKEGMRVKYEIPAYPSSEYGVVEGTVTRISKDIKVNQDTGIGYYEVEATISSKGTNLDEKQLEFIQGMAVQAKLVTEKKSVMKYLLEKIELLG